MSGKIRPYDSNIRRKTNRPFLQVSQHVLEKNYFSQIGIITEIDSDGDGHWCKVRLIPDVPFKVFDRETGYERSETRNYVITKAFKPVGIRSTLEKDDIVLLTFNDVNFRTTILNLINGKSRSSDFIETDQTRHSLNFAIVTSKLL
jgi:hypothetical protein